MNFTVLMSLYIQENPVYLEQCLQSLQNQTIQANEIVIVLDGPITSELEQVLLKWKKTLPIKSVPLNENVGLGRALNKGLEQCSNEWVFRMDTDDICLPNRFEKQLAYIKTNPNTVLLGGQIEEFTDDSNEFVVRKVPYDTSEIYQFAKKRNPFNHMTVAYKKSTIQQLGGYQHHLFMEDYNLWLRVIANHNEIHNLPTVITKARTGDAMLSRRKGKEYIKSEWKLFKLKNSLGYHNLLLGLIIFVMRGTPRLLPKQLLATIYKLQRIKN